LVQGEQRNKWQGPAGGGKDAVYAGCEIEPTGVERYQSGMRVSAKHFLRFVSSFFCFRPVLQFNLLASQRLLPERERCLWLLGLSFYPLEQAPNMVIYAMSKSRDSNERSNLSLRVLFAQAPFTDARRCCQKIHLRDWRV
jgi:hypothetical protein